MDRKMSMREIVVAPGKNPKSAIFGRRRTQRSSRRCVVASVQGHTLDREFLDSV